MIWYPEIGPNHFGHQHKSQTLKWSGLDSQERFYINLRENARVLKDLGYDDPNCIDYRYNHQGFRCDEFDDRSCIMAIGGSMTEGTGVRENETWITVLSGLIGLHVWNMGIGACAMDTCYRILDHYLPILKPHAVVLIKPPPARFELLAHYGSFDVYGPHMTVDRHDGFIKEYLISEENAAINDRKNTLAMQHICHQFDTPMFFYEPEDVDIDHRARDLMHPGRESHEKFAAKVYQDMKGSL